MLFSSVLGAFLFLHVVLAAPSETVKRNKLEKVAAYSCMRAVSKTTWKYVATGKTSSVACSYQPALGSWLYCIYETILEHGSSNITFEKAFEPLQETCVTLKNMSASGFYKSLENSTKYMQPYSTKDFNITYPVEFDAAYRNKFFNAYQGFYFNYDVGNVFGGIICAYFLGVMVFAGSLHFLNYTPYKKAILRQKIVNWVRGHTTLPTVFTKHAEGFSFLKIFKGYIPTRAESLIVFVYILLHVSFMACCYQFDPYNILFKSHRAQVARFLADRSGVMAFAHFPLIVLFAGRNNFLEYISGMKYTSFIVFHKWLGRLMFMDAVIHSAAYTNYALAYNYWQKDKEETYWKFGVAATCLASMLVFFSFGIFRKYFYELFLFLHIVLGALFFYACWKHVTSLSGIEWVYASIAIWCFDRLIRLIRILYFGFPKSKMELVGDDLLRVTIPKPKISWKAKPGQYIFISFVHLLYFWQSHPFTVMDSITKDEELVVILKSKRGVTRLIRNHVNRNGGVATMRLAIDGPYGTSSPTHYFDNVLLLAGGTGLPGPIAHAIQLGMTSLRNGKQFVKLIITVRGYDVLEAYKPELMCLKKSNVELHIYNTMKVSDTSEEKSSSESQCCSEHFSHAAKNEEKSTDPVNEVSTETPSMEGSISNDFVFAILENGRPDIKKIMTETVKQSGSLAVVCCGPPVFVDSIRNVTASAVIEHSTKAIEYFEEYQVW